MNQYLICTRNLKERRKSKNSKASPNSSEKEQSNNYKTVSAQKNTRYLSTDKKNKPIKPELSKTAKKPNNPANSNMLSLSKIRFDFFQYDYGQLEYEIDKTLSKGKKTATGNFLSRMEVDIKDRQSKEQRRKKIVNLKKPSLPEKQRIDAFNRLILDSNKRIEINKEKTNLKINNGLKYDKVGKKKWEKIYNERFMNFYHKKEEKLRKKIIDKENELKNKEEKIVEEMNKNIKKVEKNELDQIVARLCLTSKKNKVKSFIRGNKMLNKLSSMQSSENEIILNGKLEEDKKTEEDILNYSKDKKSKKNSDKNSPEKKKDDKGLSEPLKKYDKSPLFRDTKYNFKTQCKSSPDKNNTHERALSSVTKTSGSNKIIQSLKDPETIFNDLKTNKDIYYKSQNNKLTSTEEATCNGFQLQKISCNSNKFMTDKKVEKYLDKIFNIKFNLD